MQKFKPTHEMNLVSKITAKTSFVKVMLCSEPDGSGPAYTRDEWNAETNANWERDVQGYWWFKGEVAPDGWTVTVRTLPLPH